MHRNEGDHLDLIDQVDLPTQQATTQKYPQHLQGSEHHQAKAFEMDHRMQDSTIFYFPQKDGIDEAPLQKQEHQDEIIHTTHIHLTHTTPRPLEHQQCQPQDLKDHAEQANPVEQSGLLNWQADQPYQPIQVAESQLPNQSENIEQIAVPELLNPNIYQPDSTLIHLNPPELHPSSLHSHLQPHDSPHPLEAQDSTYTLSTLTYEPEPCDDPSTNQSHNTYHLEPIASALNHPDISHPTEGTHPTYHAGDGSDSPLSTESKNSNITDTAVQFYELHHGHQEQEIAQAYPEQDQFESSTSPETRMTEEGESSNTNHGDDVVLPDDGFYSSSLHVDSEMSDTDSAIGSEIQSSTMSLRSSLYQTISENGRSYHKYKEGQYYLPNDDVEQDRLNLQHHLWTLTLDGRLNLAPIDNPQYILDIGTGTGLWALEYAERHPQAIVIGTDLSAIQPEYVPPNCQFEIDDAEDEWTYSRTFDYIHGRMLFSCFQNPAEVFKRAYKFLTPGGYFEMQDVLFALESIDGTGTNSAVQFWNKKLCQGAAKIGRDWQCTIKYAQFMRDAGFEGVIERQFKWPSNTWPKGKKQKTLGMWSMANSLDGLPAASMAIMTRVHGMTREEVEVGMVDVRKDIKDKGLHGYIPVYVVYGRKPFDAHVPI